MQNPIETDRPLRAFQIAHMPHSCHDVFQGQVDIERVGPGPGGFARVVLQLALPNEELGKHCQIAFVRQTTGQSL